MTAEESLRDVIDNSRSKQSMPVSVRLRAVSPKSPLMTGSLTNGLLGFRHRTKSADRLDVDAKKHSLHRRNQRSVAYSRQRDSPPFRTLRHQSFARMFPLRGVVLRHIQFQIGSSHDYTSPVCRLPISSACRQTLGFFRIHSIFLPKVEKM